MSEAQERADAFYWSNGPCCAGCDHWRNINTLYGECAATQPGLSGEERAASLGLHGFSVTLPTGHAITRREHKCGAFADTFAWDTLPLPYLKKVGAR